MSSHPWFCNVSFSAIPFWDPQKYHSKCSGRRVFFQSAVNQSLSVFVQVWHSLEKLPVSERPRPRRQQQLAGRPFGCNQCAAGCLIDEVFLENIEKSAWQCWFLVSHPPKLTPLGYTRTRAQLAQQSISIFCKCADKKSSVNGLGDIDRLTRCQP